MKLQNKNIRKKIAFINIIMFVIFIASSILSYFNLNILKKEDEILIAVSLIGLLYMSYLGCPFFQYDSNGETLLIKNDKSFYPSLLVRGKQSDFPKRKLIKFAVKNKPFFKKELEIYIYSKRVQSGQTKICFSISYLSRKEVRDLVISLNKVVKDNQQYIEIKQNDLTQV